MMACKKRSLQKDLGIDALRKELDEALCSICMEHPHNAVLLVCSSHEKGCRPYVCDTSYRHSNCLDRYKNVKVDSANDQQNPNNTPVRSGGVIGDDYIGILQSTVPLQSNNYDMQLEVVDLESSMAMKGKMSLKCPLCRGDVQDWKVVEEARKILDMKARSCSNDSCDFVGDYQELRKHARNAHPSVRPAEIDPSRQQAWRRFEVQRENDDVVSAIRSAMPGAVVLGDYVFESENSNRNPTDRGWTPLSLFHQMVAEARRHLGGVRATTRRANEDSFRERYLNMLGLGLLDESDEEEDNDENEPSVRRRRRDEVDTPRASEATYRRMYLDLLGLRDESEDANRLNVNSGQPSARRRRLDEVNVINIDDEEDSVDLPVQRRQRLNQTEPNGNEL